MSILADIAAYKREEIAHSKAARPLRTLEGAIKAVSPPRGFAARLKERAASGPALVCEIKRASPSRGLIRREFDPAALARAFERAGAACLSVLTDGPSFQGAPEHLAAARAATTLPVLRKDFLYDPYQVFEARAWGADCVLVILAAVDDTAAQELMMAASDLGMDVLVEVHDETEIGRALALDARMIGINNRDLQTFATDLDTTLRLAPRVPEDRIVVAESGIAGHRDLVRLGAAGVCAFLVGESLMRAPDVERATRTLLEGIPA